MMADTPTPETPHEAALRYAALGLRVVPIKPGGKHPPVPEWQKVATTDPAMIDQWWTGLYRGHGVGIVTGPDSGIWALDVDTKPDGPNGYETLQGHVDAYGPLPETPRAHTGSGGMHILFAWDHTHPVRNVQGKAQPLGPGLDVRGEGGQIVVAPTVHPNGKPYHWGVEPGQTFAEAPGWLYAMLETAPEPTVTPAPPPPLPAEEDDSIAGWFTRTTSFSGLLAADGWTEARADYWVRPGKSARDGISAHLHDGEVLVIWSTNAPHDLIDHGKPTADGSGASVNLFGYYAATRHGGDRSAAARHLRQERTRLEGRPTPATAWDLAAAFGTADETTIEALAGHAETRGFTNLAQWWDGDYQQKETDVLLRTDGRGLLYGDQLNWMHGDSGSGKTWVLLAAMAQMVKAGGHVAWVHYEDPNPAAITHRLKLLGVPRDMALERFHYLDPAGDQFDARLVVELCGDVGATFVGLDSIGEALNASGVNEDSDAEVGPWITNGPRAVVNAGIGFCGVDHGTKAGTNKLHPSGSKRKRAALTGMGLFVEPVHAPTVDQDGTMRVTCAKDRHGNYPQGKTVGMAHLRHNIVTGGLDFSIDAPGDASVGADSHETRVREVVRMVADTPGVSENGLLPLLSTASKQRKYDAIADAIERNLIAVKWGDRGAKTLWEAEEK